MPVDQDSCMRTEISAISQGLQEVKGTLSKVVDVLERMARLEERHANTANALERAFSSISKIESRVGHIERQQPMQKLVAGWVINGAWAAVGVFATIALKKIGLM